MEYNSQRPHESLNTLTPEEYRLMAEKPEISEVCGTKTGGDLHTFFLNQGVIYDALPKMWTLFSYPNQQIHIIDNKRVILSVPGYIMFLHF